MPLPYVAPTEDWSELDALVGAELDIMLARSSSPVTEPEAGAYLGRHPDPQRVINEMASRLPATAPNEPVEPETPEEADDEPA
jgi:hypothetical protein